jgi:hypothetical protein
MSDERLQPGFPPPQRSSRSRTGRTGRVFAKRDFELWHTATVEFEDDAGVLVVFDNIDEATVAPDDVVPVDLKLGDVVFAERQERFLGGVPAEVTKLLREAVEVRYLNPLQQLDDRFVELLRDIRWYADEIDVLWKKGDRVIAYRPRDLQPRVTLFFPGTVQDFHYGVCAEIDFDDGIQALVPMTLIQALTLAPGDLVYVRNDPHAFVIAFERCCVLECREGEAVVEDLATGEITAIHMSAVGVVPRGYEMREEKLVKL